MAADPVHLLFDRLPQILQEAKAVGELPRPWSALAGSLRMQTAPVAADYLNRGMLAASES